MIGQRVTGESHGAARIEVAATPIGRVAVLAGDDLQQPEYARLAMFAGAEILLSPCAERRDERARARHLSRGARAWENHAMVAAARARPPRSTIAARRTPLSSDAVS